MAQLNLRLDDELKEESAKFFNDIGMDLSTGIKIYLTKVVKEQAIPFTLSLGQDDLSQALKEIESGNYKTFNNKQELMEELNNED
ncbi:type II toxin-antitoxin system RelB/DinJ family antitoxin [Enterococcus sp. BWB1-3]|uniref:type II toxin-antitoxin system RelB/DinJ family antitoxin n=1 Tax=unclassified Enterococcus TaxID=2608891 RepID=UPI0019245469|nr:MULTISPECIES: type II toxin-antitoxin system RelB/DinJ family antitoxin [unclassified Enterococcus]MBL1228489.1 type II toxin-antitoxin system RelB/DinJ family antitoxin [Enterococcus sp. BWB1-3]MCB5950494.1 type II toxin-antitoxin system RelB/DinJ family antitoxin [Enterococcus sp. BWT-B8]MCB5954376.1 type II toxin-antitoxin system RelB/DinJ family antitoxin [Enterococcus sp. CWB-B31]